MGLEKVDVGSFSGIEKSLVNVECSNFDLATVSGKPVSGHVLEPWDLLRGKCVFRDRFSFDETTSAADLVHFAPNCSTFSRAREIPIPGVAHPPRPVRSESHPEGIPEELQSMSEKSRRKLEDDTEMANMSARRCLERHQQGKAFTLEHPGRSLALHLQSWQKLKESEGVMLVEYTTCMFQGSRRRKKQLLLCNREEFRGMGKVCSGNRVCDRTGLPHLKWRPTTSGGKVVQFTTGDEREYPAGFCQAYAACVPKLLGQEGSFVEIFSGPNAPLSQAIADLYGEVLQGGRLQTERGVKTELRRLAQLVDTSSNAKVARHKSSPGKSMEINQAPETAINRRSMLEAGRQPGYGKRVQLIADGLQSPSHHLELALQLEHPFDTLAALKDDHQAAIERQPDDCHDLNMFRLKTLAEWRVLSRRDDVIQLQSHHETLACSNAKKLGRRPRTALMTFLSERYRIEDVDIACLCLTGLPIVGDALESPFFEWHEVPAMISLRELLSTANQRRGQTLNRVAYMAKKSSDEQARAIYQKTLKEVAKGTMSGPFDHSQLVARFGRHYNVIPSFGLEQGTDDHGCPKFRRIDDHTAGHTNLAATRKQRIVMAMADYLTIMIRSHWQRHRTSILIGTEDMQGAYRQLAIPDTQTMIAVTAVYDPDRGEARMFLMHGQPFGAGHAVPNFYRLAEWASRVLIRGMSLMVDHFFDDYFYLERQPCAKVAQFCIQETFKLLGLTLDPDKSQPPAEVASVLGVAFNTTCLLTERRLLVEPKPSRRSNFIKMVDRILEQGILNPSLAASLLGKFGFLCSTLFGKVGRFCTGLVRQRQYSLGADVSLTQDLRIALKLMQHVVSVAPSRACHLGRQHKPAILYTDASDVPGRDPRFGLGGVLILQEPDFRIEFFSTSVPQAIVDSWFSRSTYMGQLEALACPVALTVWKSLLHNHKLIHWIDNDAVAASIVRGYSPKQDSTWIISEYWSLAAEFGIDVYIDRVESKSNLSDGPSRFDVSSLVAMGAVQVPAIFQNFNSSSVYQLFRDECCAPARAVSVAPQHSEGEKEATYTALGKAS